MPSNSLFICSILYLFRNNQDNRDLNGLNMFISDLKSILSSLKTESFLDSSLWCQFREIQIQMIHRVICITSKEGESAELLSQLENDSEVIDKIISEIDQRWKTELDHPFIREVSFFSRFENRLSYNFTKFLEIPGLGTQAKILMCEGTLSKANNRCQKTLSNSKCKTLSGIGPYMYKNCPHHKKRYDLE